MAANCTAGKARARAGLRTSEAASVSEISKRLHALTSFDGLSARHISYVRNLEKLARVVVDMLGLIESENHDQEHDKDYEKLQRDMIRKQLRRAMADVLDAGGP